MELVPTHSEVKGNPGQAEPRNLGKYPLLGVIGKGSMGILYRSVDPHIKRPVALKTIRRDLLEQAQTENFSARFRVEAQAAGGLAHPGIVSVYEYGEEDAYAYIAMEYIEGRSLRECFEQKMPFSIGQVVSVVSQLLDALQYAHDRGVWHRDIKPANILITPSGQVKVTDFGIARVESSMLTQVGAIMGTPVFIAPEMYLGDTFDHRVDLFAAGVVLYQLLAGVPPFTGSAEKVMFKVCYEVPLPPSIAGRLPSLQPFDSVVMRALARDPDERFADAGEFLKALHESQANSGRRNPDATIIQARPVTPAPSANSQGSGLNSGAGGTGSLGGGLNSSAGGTGSLGGGINSGFGGTGPLGTGVNSGAGGTGSLGGGVGSGGASGAGPLGAGINSGEGDIGSLSGDTSVLSPGMDGVDGRTIASGGTSAFGIGTTPLGAGFNSGFTAGAGINSGTGGGTGTGTGTGTGIGTGTGSGLNSIPASTNT